jgi:RNA polymerase-binding protein DksA
MIRAPGRRALSEVNGRARAGGRKPRRRRLPNVKRPPSVGAKMPGKGFDPEETTMALTQNQLAELVRALDKRYGSLLEDVRDELEKSENQQYVELLGRAPADTGDESVADSLADLNLALIDRQIRDLRDIEAAKGRISSARFGLCIDCGAEIGFERLLAHPTAKRCLACQHQRERTHAHEGTPTL